LAKRYRVSRKGKTTANKKEQGGLRWPWVLLLLSGFIFIVAMGISSSTPEANGIVLSIASSISRVVSSISGTFSMPLSFLIILTSIVKISSSSEPLPRFVWGFWVLLVFISGIYHDLVSPFESTFAFAKSGGGAGYIGAATQWFVRVSLGRVFGFLALSMGIGVGLSLLFGKSPWTPFSFIWMMAMSAWQWFKSFLAEFFRPQGPEPEDLEPDAIPMESPLSSFSEARDYGYHESSVDTTFSDTVSELRAKLEARDQQQEPSPLSEVLESNVASSKEDDSEFQINEEPSSSDETFYDLPSLDILQTNSSPRKTKSVRALEERARTIEKTLLSFGIVAKVVNAEPGPTVTRFELQPGPGVKVASIVNLGQDLALALAAQDVRIEAPIPGRSAVGIEVPNKEVSVVHLRDVLASREFRNSKSPLTIALGQDISGRPMVTSLDRCLHLLIAGATGSGKSVCINTIITSLLYKARPDQVKLILIDPKRVELSVWGKVPHLIAPVVTDPKKAAGALRWSIKEMESRYEKFTKVGTRDIERYNQVATPPDSVKPAMPYVIIIIDELSDLMTVAPAEVEDSIFRLAQMARASGIYLVIATQRPSVDVLTGTIKANIPSRIAFAVSSQIDSRTILDMGGAEKLLGRGDMLFHPIGASKPLRAQGCYISEREIDELVSFVSQQAKPQFASGILTEPESLKTDTEVQDDPLFSQALRIVVEAKQASVSLLQRKLPIGYSRAARLIDALETKGYIGPYEGSKPREVKLTIQQYMSMFEEKQTATSESAATSSPSPEVERKGQFPKETGPSLGDKFESTYPRPRRDDYGRKERWN
jgi:S-DNA-T family DNA segregation ATPase FtsK/SpoIIIE